MIGFALELAEEMNEFEKTKSRKNLFIKLSNNALKLASSVLVKFHKRKLFIFMNK